MIETLQNAFKILVNHSNSLWTKLCSEESRAQKCQPTYLLNLEQFNSSRSRIRNEKIPWILTVEKIQKLHWAFKNRPHKKIARSTQQATIKGRSPSAEQRHHSAGGSEFPWGPTRTLLTWVRGTKLTSHEHPLMQGALSPTECATFKWPASLSNTYSKTKGWSALVSGHQNSATRPQKAQGPSVIVLRHHGQASVIQPPPFSSGQGLKQSCLAAGAGQVQMHQMSLKPTCSLLTKCVL